MEPSSAVIPVDSKKAVTVARYAWVILAVAFIAGVAAPLNQNKVSPLMTMLMDAFQVDLSTAGLLTSVFAITGFLLALPAGIILQRLGLKASAMIAMGSLVIGSVLGALASTYTVLLVSRVIEGAGLGLIAVIGPASIALWFPPEKQGLPMGVWSTWMPAGSVLSAIAAAAMASQGWQSLWWFCAAFSLIAFLLVAFFMRTPPAAESSAGKAAGAQQAAPAGEGAVAGLMKALANRDIWLLALAFACFNMAIMSVMVYYPTYLSTVLGYSTADASLSLIMTTAGSLVSSLMAGALLDRLGSRKLMMLAPFLILAVLMLFPFSISPAVIPVWMVGLGLIAGALAVSTFSSVPPIMVKPQLAGIGMAVLVIGQNVGQFIGAPIFGAIVEQSGWAAAALWMIPVLLLGAGVTWLIRVR